MGVAHVGLVYHNPCECKVKGFCAVSFIERNVSKRRHLQGMRQQPMHSKLPRTVGGTVFYLFIVESVPIRVQKVVQFELLS